MWYFIRTEENKGGIVQEQKRVNAVFDELFKRKRRRKMRVKAVFTRTEKVNAVFYKNKRR